jgi:hypothetical protein
MKTRDPRAAEAARADAVERPVRLPAARWRRRPTVPVRFRTRWTAGVALLVASCIRLPAGWLYITDVTAAAATIAWTGEEIRAIRCHAPDGTVHEGPITSRPSGLRFARVAGLAAATTYTCRSVRADGARGRRVRFRTAPAAAGIETAPFTFAVVGDTGDGSEAAATLARRILAARPAFLVHLGDLAYPDGTPDELDERFFGPYGRLLARVPIFPTPGNHDLSSRGGYPELFFPTLRAGGRDGLDYGFDWGAARFLSLSSPSFEREAARGLAWLSEQLAAARERPWRIVFAHHPPFTTSPKFWPEFGRAVLPVLEAGRADLVLGGHAHLYERADLACMSDPDARVLTIVSGGGGDDSLEPARDHPNVPRNFPRPHFVRVRVRPSSIEVWAVGRRGQILDHVRHRRGSTAPCRRGRWWWRPETPRTGGAREGALPERSAE